MDVFPRVTGFWFPVFAGTLNFYPWAGIPASEARLRLCPTGTSLPEVAVGAVLSLAEAEIWAKAEPVESTGSLCLHIQTFS